MERQAARSVPLPPAKKGRRTMAESIGYRLRLLHITGLPVYAMEGRTFDLRIGVTMFDQATGQFYGNTCYSAPISFENKSSGRCGLTYCSSFLVEN